MNKELEKWKKRLAAVRGKTLIGLTGPIASGKSLALDCFRKEGALCISADAVAAEVLTSPACYNRILLKFGTRTILTNGFLDKERLAAEIFSAPAKRKWLESLLHPEILKRIHSLTTKSRKKVVVVEAPLLFEAGLAGCFTITICLSAPEKELRRRAMGRGWTRAQYLARAKAQLGAPEKYALADLTLDNGGKPGDLRKRVRALYRFINNAAGEN
ncbi:MAG TPA: dephospho-CoA kinase [Elusimicrobia bacterium]|nr:MAG: dephospho-CoA kinase [Elusimicrobia bacterium GWF2_62_30]HBA60331.1 dephospho-CoA kinase [Elusimicrobiota bacterium]